MCFYGQSAVSLQWCPQCGLLWNRWGRGRYLYISVKPRAECPEGMGESICPNCSEKSAVAIPLTSQS